MAKGAPLFANQPATFSSGTAPRLSELVEQPGVEQGGVDVAVARRAPLELGVLGPLDRGQVVDEQARLAVLQELQRQPLDRKVLVALERGQAVLGGAEGVHQQQREAYVVLLAHVQDLAGDHVQEAQALAHAQQRLGAVHAHRGAEATVELDHRGGGDGGVRLVVADHGVTDRRDVDRLDRVLRDHPGLPVLELAVVICECLHRDVIHAGVAHLRHCLGQTWATHKGKPRLSLCRVHTPLRVLKVQPPLTSWGARLPYATSC